MTPPFPRPRSLLAAAAVVALVAPVTPAVADDEPAAEPDWDAAYRALVARGRPHHLRAVIEEAALIGAGAAWYWIDRDRQVADWDFPSLKQRVTLEALRFDNNPFPINFAWHAVDGAQYHVIGRANDMSLLTSVGYGLATSLAWEIGLEFREKTSINDVIVTTGAGTAVGEFFHWLGRYLESAPSPRPWHPVARWTLTTTRAAHNALDDVDRLRPGTAPDALGLSDDIWHRFHLSSGFARGAFEGEAITLGEVRASGELVAIPGFLRARSLRRSFRDGNVTTARLRVTGGADAIGLELGADTLLVGWHGQTLDARGIGAATTVGVSIAYDYRRELLGPWTERLAQMHLPGLGVDHHELLPGARVRVRGRVWADFAGLHAAGHDTWKADHLDAREKTILQKHGYYYAWGLATRLEAELELRRVSLGGRVAWATYDSQEGLDRTQESVTLDVDLRDRAFELDAWLRVAPWGRRGYVEARVLHEDRDSRIGDVRSDRSLTRWMLAVGAAL